jgi:hypothetical protein
MLAPKEFLRAASTGRLSIPVTVQPTTPQQVPALQRLVESQAFKAIVAERMQSKEPAVALSPAVLASLPLNPSVLAPLGSLRFLSPEPVKADLAPNATVAPPQPAAMAQQYVEPPATNISGQTAFVHVTTAEELWALVGQQKQPVDPTRVAIGASAGAAVGLGYALVRQSVAAVHPASGVIFDLGWILIGAGLGAGASAAWQLTYDPEKQTFGIMPASAAFKGPRGISKRPGRS